MGHLSPPFTACAIGPAEVVLNRPPHPFCDVLASLIAERQAKLLELGDGGNWCFDLLPGRYRRLSSRLWICGTSALCSFQARAFASVKSIACLEDRPRAELPISPSPRAFLLERGLVFAKRPAQLKAAMADVLENAGADLTPMMRNLISTLWDEWKTVEGQIEELGEELDRISAADAGCTRIRQIPGIGPVVATAIVAGSATAQPSARGGTSRRGWGSYRGSTPRVGRPGYSASASGVTCTCARC